MLLFFHTTGRKLAPSTERDVTHGSHVTGGKDQTTTPGTLVLGASSPESHVRRHHIAAVQAGRSGVPRCAGADRRVSTATPPGSHEARAHGLPRNATPQTARFRNSGRSGRAHALRFPRRDRLRADRAATP